MPSLKIHYPTKPFTVTQAWGAPNGSYATQFNDPDFKLHNGIDFKPQFFDKSGYLVYCPVAGFKVDKVQYRPDGGGNEVWLISKEPVQMFERECYAYIALCHAEKILVKPGDEPELGELLMVGDNTGFSTGPHTHMGLYRVEQRPGGWSFIDKNDATGSFDPSLFMTNEFAVDKATIHTLIKSGLRYYQYRLGLSS